MSAADLVIAELALKATAILSIAFMLAYLARRISAEERHLIWAAALLCLLALPVLAMLGPAFEVRVASFAAELAERPQAHAAQAAAAAHPPGPALMPGAAAAGGRTAAPDGLD